MKSLYHTCLALLSTTFNKIFFSRSAREEYGDDAIGYVQVQAKPGQIVVKGKVTPEHRVNTAPYGVTVSINTLSGTIEEASCHGCQARHGGCKHATAFLFWLHRRSSEKAVTEVQCYWTKPRLANISNMSPMKARNMGGRKRQGAPNEPDNFLDLVKKEMFDGGHRPTGVFFDIISGWRSPAVDPLDTSMDVICKGCPIGDIALTRTYLSGKLDPTLVSAVCSATIGQKESRAWYHLRFGRVTASKLYEASRCKTMAGSLTETILGCSKFKGTAATKRGVRLEPVVITEVQAALGVEVATTGLHLLTERPVFAASPDGLCQMDGKLCTIEVKCPSGSKTVEKYIQADKSISVKVRAQMQLQMLAAGAGTGILCVADPSFEVNKKVTVIRDDLDMAFIEPIMAQAESFWHRAILPMLV